MALQTIGPRRRAISDSIIAQMLGGVLPTLLRSGGLSALLIVSLLGAGAEFEIGVAFLVMQWAMLIRMLVSPRVDTSRRQRFLVRWMLASSFIALGFLVAPVLAVFGYPRLAVWGFILVLAAFFLTMNVGSAAWFPLLQYIVPSRLRGRYFGTMRQYWQLVGFGAVFLAGLVLGAEPSPALFILVIVPAVGLQFGRVFMYARLPDPPPARTTNRESFGRRLAMPFRDKPFRKFMLYVGFVSLAQHAALPFVVPFLKTVLGFPASYTMYSTALFGMGSVISLLLWGRLADRWGNRAVFLLALVIGILAFVMLAWTPAYDVTRKVLPLGVAAGSMILIGVCAAGTGIAHTVRLMHLAPVRDSGPYLNSDQAVIGIVSGLGALTAGIVLSKAPEFISIGGRSMAVYRVFFVLIAVIISVLAACVRLLPRIAEPGLRHAIGGMADRLPGWSHLARLRRKTAEPGD